MFLEKAVQVEGSKKYPVLDLVIRVRYCPYRASVPKTKRFVNWGMKSSCEKDIIRPDVFRFDVKPQHGAVGRECTLATNYIGLNRGN